MSTYAESAIDIMQTNLGDVLYNLSYVLSDNDDGLMPDSNAKYIIDNLQVSPIGMVQSNVPSPIHPSDATLFQDVFNPITSARCTDLFSLLLISDSSIVYRSEYPVDKPTSPILDVSADIPSTVESMLCYLYMEMYSLYTALVEHQSGNTFVITDVELSTIMSNTRAISTALGNVTNDSIVYPLLDILRYVQRAILLVKYYMPTILE